MCIRDRYLNGFLEYSRANGVILDLFSWHSYADVTDNVKYAEYARQKLDSFGYRETEIYLDEWNPGVEQKGLLRDAANIAAGMCLMQGTPTDMCMYYDAQITSELCGMFDFVAHDVYKAYYAFYAFHKLYVLGREATSNSNMEGVYCCAATDGNSAGLLIVNQMCIRDSATAGMRKICAMFQNRLQRCGWKTIMNHHISLCIQKMSRFIGFTMPIMPHRIRAVI